MALDTSRPASARFHVWLAALACFFAVFGARTAFVSAFGSDLPMWDQWDAESERLLLPYEQGRLRFGDLFEPHNEHRVVVTKLLALGITLANGQWDARLECIVNAAMMAALATWVMLLGRRLIAPRWRVPWLLAVFATFAAPLSWQNLTGGFHTQQTLLIGLSLAAIGGMLTGSPTQARWWIGAVSAGLALFTMASGLLAAAAVVGAIIITTRPRDWLRRHGATLALCALVLAAGASLYHPAPHHEPLKAHSVGEFVLCFWRSLQWPVLNVPLYAVVAWLPWAMLTWRVRNRPGAVAPAERIIVGGGVWVLLQFLASAHARGAGGAWPADRYFDTVGFGIALNALALFVLLSREHLAGWRAVLRGATAMVGLVLLGQGLWAHVATMIRDSGPSLRSTLIDREYHTRAYLHTGDVAWLRPDHIPHPSVEVLRRQLVQDEIASRMPASARRTVSVPGMDTPGQGFAPAGIPAGSALSPGWPVLGSFTERGAQDRGSWTSGTLPKPKFGYWLIPVATNLPGAPDLALTVEIPGASREIVLRHDDDPRLPGAAWSFAVLRAPDGPAQLHAADNSALGWLAFGAPVEMAAGSYWAWRIAAHGLAIFGVALAAGLVLELLALGRAGLRTLAPQWVGAGFDRILHPAAVAIAVAGLTGIAAFFLVDPREPAFFVATLRGSLNEKSVELFYDRGHGIRGADSAQSWFHEDIDHTVIRMPLPAGTYRAFRFDPMDFGATTVIEDPRVENENGAVLWRIPPELFVAGTDLASVRVDGNRVVATATPDGEDPQLHVRLDPPASTQPGGHGWLRRWILTVLWAGAAGLLIPPGVVMLPHLIRAGRAEARGLSKRPWGRYLRDSWHGLRRQARLPRVQWFAVPVIALAILIVRETDTFTNPQLWAEDASLFYIQAVDLGLASVWLPYNGYLHAIPRLLSLIGPLVDPLWLPATCTWLSALVVMLAVAHTLSPRLDLPYKAALALAIVLVPHSGEVYGNLTNTQWFSAIVLLQMALKRDGTTTLQRVGDVVIVLLTALSGPFCVMFLPAFLWRLWRTRTLTSAVVVGAVVMSAAIQLHFIMQMQSTALHYETGPINTVGLFLVVARRVALAVLTGGAVLPIAPKWSAAIAGLGALAAMAVLCLRRRQYREAKLVLWLAIAAVLIVSIPRCRFDMLRFENLTDNDRYFFIPKLLFCWLLILEAAAPRWHGRIFQGVLAIALAANLSILRIPPQPDHRWREQCEPMRRGEKADIPITPTGWIFQYPGRPR
jgi:hypothetical protein